VILENIELTESYIKREYPNEQFISEISSLHLVNKHCKGLVIPSNVKVAVSRLPFNAVQRSILRKELLQAETLAKLGNAIYLIPEHETYGKKCQDAVVNGELFEFKTIIGNARTLEWEFRNAKKKGADVNVFIQIESAISKNEARRKIGLVLENHPEYIGKIIISFTQENKIYFWDCSQF
jgi:hypothetical protein